MQAISPASGADPASEAAPAAAPSARMGDARHASYPGLAAALIGHAAAEAAAGARAAMQLLYFMNWNVFQKQVKN